MANLNNNYNNNFNYNFQKRIKMKYELIKELVSYKATCNVKRCVLSKTLKVFNDWHCLISGGSRFHTLGTTFSNTLSPSVFIVL